MKRIIIAVSVIILIAGIASAKDLKTCKATYEREIDAIILSHQTNMTKIRQQYGKSLNALLARVQKTGDLDKTTAVMDEIARFGKEKLMPDQPSALTDIQDLQSSFRKQSSNYEASKVQKINSLTKKYVQALEKLQKSLVTQGKIDEAITVKNEREIAKGRISEPAKNTEPALVNNDSASPVYPEGSFKFMSHYYYRLPLRQNFCEASEICKELGGHILSINSSIEYKHFLKLARADNLVLLLDINDMKTEGSWKSWKNIRASFTKWHPGEPNDSNNEDAVCINYKNTYDMVDVSASNSFHTVYCEWESNDTPKADAIKDMRLCEVKVKGNGIATQKLKTGAARLSGGYQPTFSHVASDLIGAQFTRVPWQSRLTIHIEVIKSGYLYAYNIHEWSDKKKHKWTHVPDAVKGAYLNSGAYRLRVNKGQTFSIHSYEPGVIAARVIK
jgi:hypothetical protein